MNTSGKVAIAVGAAAGIGGLIYALEKREGNAGVVIDYAYIYPVPHQTGWYTLPIEESWPAGQAPIARGVLSVYPHVDNRTANPVSGVTAVMVVIAPDGTKQRPTFNSTIPIDIPAQYGANLPFGGIVMAQTGVYTIGVTLLIGGKSQGTSIFFVKGA